jgi:hypothetical protein
MFFSPAVVPSLEDGLAHDKRGKKRNKSLRTSKGKVERWKDLQETIAE